MGHATAKSDIDLFLAEHSIAFAGVSRTASRFGNKVYEKLKACGHELHPVHPEIESFDGDTCACTMGDLPDHVRALMVVAGPSVCRKLLGEVLGTNISRVWVFTEKRGEAEVESEADRLRESGLSVITAQCPFMYLQPMDSFHALHRFCTRLFGRYPQ